MERTPAERGELPATAAAAATITAAAAAAVTTAAAAAVTAAAAAVTAAAATNGEPYARLAILLNEARGWAKRTLPTYQDRKEFFEGIVNGRPDPIELLRAGDEAAVVALIEDAIVTREREAAAA